MNDHISHSNVHLFGVGNVNTVEVAESLLKYLLSLVHFRIFPHLDHPIMNLLGIHLIEDLISRYSTGAACIGFE